MNGLLTILTVLVVNVCVLCADFEYKIFIFLSVVFM